MRRVERHGFIRQDIMNLSPQVVIGVASSDDEQQLFLLFIEPVKKLNKLFHIERIIEIMMFFHCRCDHVKVFLHMLNEHVIRGCVMQIERFSVYVGPPGKLGNVDPRRAFFYDKFHVCFLYRLPGFDDSSVHVLSIHYSSPARSRSLPPAIPHLSETR